MNRADAQASVLRPIWWNEDAAPGGALELLDQTRLPNEVVAIRCTSVRSVWEAIQTLQVRGAPAIGVAAAYGVVVGFDEAAPGVDDWPQTVSRLCDYLASSRPTAVNLFRALDRMRSRAQQLGRCDPARARAALLEEAHRIRAEDAAMCRGIGEAGHPLIRDGSGVLTHCNAGALATSEYGTALAVLYAAHQQGRRFEVYVDETRPLLQGARLTTWELLQAGIATTLICDSTAAVLLKDSRVHLVITGADRIAANGDTANKIGTYGLAVQAAAHNVPFYVAAPSSTFDLALADGDGIPIEHRDPEEIRTVMGLRIAPEGVACHCPAFDVTPARLISGIITERGIVTPVTRGSIAAVLGADASTWRH